MAPLLLLIDFCQFIHSKLCSFFLPVDPPPRAHIYKAIVIHLLNHKQHQFLMEARGGLDLSIIDFLQVKLIFI